MTDVPVGVAFLLGRGGWKTGVGLIVYYKVNSTGLTGLG